MRKHARKSPSMRACITLICRATCKKLQAHTYTHTHTRSCPKAKIKRKHFQRLHTLTVYVRSKVVTSAIWRRAVGDSYSSCAQHTCVICVCEHVSAIKMIRNGSVSFSLDMNWILLCEYYCANSTAKCIPTEIKLEKISRACATFFHPNKPIVFDGFM